MNYNWNFDPCNDPRINDSSIEKMIDRDYSIITQDNFQDYKWTDYVNLYQKTRKQLMRKLKNGVYGKEQKQGIAKALKKLDEAFYHSQKDNKGKHLEKFFSNEFEALEARLLPQDYDVVETFNNMKAVLDTSYDTSDETEFQVMSYQANNSPLTENEIQEITKQKQEESGPRTVEENTEKAVKQNNNKMMKLGLVALGAYLIFR